VTSHISLLETHVEDNGGFAELANQRAVQARDVAAGGTLMATVNTSMQAIVTRSSEMGITTLIDNIAFQTNIRLLTPQSRQHMPGSKGVGLPWLRKKLGWREKAVSLRKTFRH
jgi:methyl-accepting chemotaxis protein-1 (serine sensor receptor)